MGWHLRYEARAGARFRAIYRLIHGVVPNVALSHVLKLIHSVPTENGNRSLQDFFHAADLFGEDYAGMRIALRDSVREYFRAETSASGFLPGELGRTFNFLSRPCRRRRCNHTRPPSVGQPGHVARLKLSKLCLAGL
jgi:hypothetical protein